MLSIDKVSYSSPNFNERDPAVPLQYIVLHYTGMKTGTEALLRLCDPKSEVSAHFVIEEDGRIFQLVDENKRAWHAGKSSWQGVTDMNSASIGIELVNPGHQFGYRPFPATQIAALRKLLDDLTQRHNLSHTHCLVAHADIAPTRKEDPGELFPWEDLAKAGFGLWPQLQDSDYGHADDIDVQKMLVQIGYDCPQSGHYDRETRPAVIAFQRHYEPNNLTGTPERETIARLRAVIRMLKA
jgi:N-acetylmuramoyl-L-alanine amidase